MIEDVFGYGDGRTIRFPKQEIEVGTWQGDEIKKSFLGTPILHPINFLGTEEAEGIFLFDVLTTISQEKNIVKTAMQGKAGTVKEFISNGDYMINIEGALYDEASREYPYTLVNRFRKLMELPEALKVSSDFLELFKIYEIVIESVAYPEKAGYPGVQLFSIKASSDEPLELRIQEDV